MYLIFNSTYSLLAVLVSPGAAASYLISDEEACGTEFQLCIDLAGNKLKKKKKINCSILVASQK